MHVLRPLFQPPVTHIDFAGLGSVWGLGSPSRPTGGDTSGFVAFHNQERDIHALLAEKGVQWSC